MVVLDQIQTSSWGKSVSGVLRPVRQAALRRWRVNLVFITCVQICRVDITVGHTPDSDDAFMFYGMLDGRIRKQALPYGT